MNAWLFNSSHPQVWCGLDDNVLTERGEMRHFNHFEEKKVINLYIMKAKNPKCPTMQAYNHLKRNPFSFFVLVDANLQPPQKQWRSSLRGLF